MAEERLKRALTLRDIANAKIPRFEFTGAWLDAYGRPQRAGIWFLFDISGSGKTSFVLQLIKEMSAHGKVLFESYEEGEKSVALQEGITRFGMEDIKDVFVVTDTLDDLIKRLSRKSSPDIVFVDSLDVSPLRSISDVLNLTRLFPAKTFIYIGQAKGIHPRSELGVSVMFISNQKIFIDGYRAFARGRSFGEKGYFDIWPEKSAELHEYK